MLAFSGLVIVMCVCYIGSMTTNSGALEQGAGKLAGQELLTGVTL